MRDAQPLNRGEHSGDGSMLPHAVHALWVHPCFEGLLTLPRRCVPCRDIHGRRSEIVLRSLWQTLLMNVLYGLSNPRIDNWCGVSSCPCCMLCGVRDDAAL